MFGNNELASTEEEEGESDNGEDEYKSDGSTEEGEGEHEGYDTPHAQVQTESVVKHCGGASLLVGVNDTEPGDFNAGPRDPESAVASEGASTE